MTARACAWCRGPIAPGARRDAVYCSQSCRQAAHRFRRDASHRDPHDGTPSRSMRFAYADPPYPGLAGYYRDHPDYAGEVDHRALLEQLGAGLDGGELDGWALSTSSRALPFILGLCQELGLDVRVAAWVRGPRGRAQARRPVQAWEPVVYAGGREGGRVRLDALVHHARPRRTDPDHVIGAKPARFARWLFDLLGAEPGDELIDMFPGSGGISRAWLAYTSTEYSRDASAAAQPDTSPSTSSDASRRAARNGSLPESEQSRTVEIREVLTGVAEWSAFADAQYARALGVLPDEASR